MIPSTHEVSWHFELKIGNGIKCPKALEAALRAQ